MGKKESVPQKAIVGEVPTQIKNPELVQERRRQIVDSTVKLFVRHGYHKTTTRMIAKAANFSIGSLYEYVSSKEDLLYLVCKNIHEEVQEAVEEALARTGGGRERLAEVIREYFFVCDKMADHMLLMYQVTQFLPEKWRNSVLENELNITDIFIQALGQLSGKGNFPRMDGKMMNLVGHNISVLGHMWAFRRWHLKHDYSIDEYITLQTDFILGLVFEESV
ncbi:MAG: TetR/AcrR family transcriptional regulator [Desulfobacteraceae bacterium]|nr:MAG: TetR/AcrR family transcriptional regulator [Desulfobacteraceae bacterium]